MSTRLIHMDVVFHREDESGRVHKFNGSIPLDDSWNQWGASTDILGDNVDVMEALSNAYADNGR